MGDVQIASALANLSAVGILGYWLIWGLPHTLRQIDESHDKIVSMLVESNRRDREAHHEIQAKFAEALGKLTDELQNICKIAEQEPIRGRNR